MSISTWCTPIANRGYEFTYVIHELTVDGTGTEIKFIVNEDWADLDMQMYGRTCARAERDDYQGDYCAEKPYKFTDTMMNIYQEDLDSICDTMDMVSNYLSNTKFIHIVDTYEL